MTLFVNLIKNVKKEYIIINETNIIDVLKDELDYLEQRVPLNFNTSADSFRKVLKILLKSHKETPRESIYFVITDIKGLIRGLFFLDDF